MADKKGQTEQFHLPPPKLTGWESFRLFLWNGETSEVLGRTGGSWGKLNKSILFLSICISNISRTSDLWAEFRQNCLVILHLCGEKQQSN